MAKEYLISDFLKRIKRPIDLEENSEYKLVTIRMNHKGIVQREVKKGFEIKSNMYLVKEGDFILSGIDARNGAFGIIPKELDDAIVTNDFWYFEIDESIILKELFLELTATNWFDEICKKGSDGTTQRIRLQKDKFFNQTVLLPEIFEQKYTLEKFKRIKSKINDLSEEKNKQVKLTSGLKQSILKDAIQGKLTAEWRKHNQNIEPAAELLKRIKAEIQKLIKERKLKKEKELAPIPESEIPFELPEGWLWCRLGNIVQHNAGKTLHKGNNTGILKDYLTTSNVYWGIFKLDNVKQIQIEPKEYERCTATKGDLLICEGGDVGRSAIWNEDYEICIQNHIHRVRPYCKVNAKYIYYYMNYLHSNNLILDYKKGMGIGNLSGTALASIKLTLPPLEEQQAIVEKVDMLMNKCLKLSQEIEILEKHGITLMKAMFNETFETNKILENEIDK